jgi:hypothetical protein
MKAYHKYQALDLHQRGLGAFFAHGHFMLQNLCLFDFNIAILATLWYNVFNIIQT